jgi:outer membrane protein assembly factor BamB
MVLHRVLLCLLCCCVALGGCAEAPAVPTPVPTIAAEPTVMAAPTEVPEVKPASPVVPATAVTPPGGARSGTEETDERALAEILLPLDGGTGPVPDTLVVGRNDTRRAITLAYLRGDLAQVVWEQTLPADSFRSIQLAANDTVALASVNDRLLAVDRASGDRLWQTTLTDSLLRTCEGCLRIVGDLAIVLPQDGMLTGFDLKSGKTIWQERLNGTPSRLFLIGNLLVMPDLQDLDSEVASLQSRKPEDGSQVYSIGLACPVGADGSVRQPALDLPILQAADSQSLYLAIAGDGGCVVRADPGVGLILWSAPLASADPPALLSTPGGVYVAAGKTLTSYAYADGAQTALAIERDYLRRPIAATEGMLLFEAIRTRGSRRIEIWGIDPATGERRWSHRLPTSEPRDEGTASWDANLLTGGLVVALLNEDRNRLLVTTLQPGDGSAKEISTDLSDSISFWYGVVWGERYAWIMLRFAQVFDSEQGRMAYHWP